VFALGRTGNGRYRDAAAPMLTDPRLLDYDTSECPPTDAEVAGNRTRRTFCLSYLGVVHPLLTLTHTPKLCSPIGGVCTLLVAYSYTAA